MRDLSHDNQYKQGRRGLQESLRDRERGRQADPACMRKGQPGRGVSRGRWNTCLCLVATGLSGRRSRRQVSGQRERFVGGDFRTFVPGKGALQVGSRVRRPPPLRIPWTYSSAVRVVPTSAWWSPTV
jgi:hypothetical protein